MKKILDRLLPFALISAALMQLNGCATVTAGLESALTPPSISDTVDSFESAALAIKTSNRILLQAPISEQEAWPEMLYKAPSSNNALKMGLSAFGMSQGVTIPTEFDPETGFPRPTSALYILIKDRNEMLNKELRKTYINYFKNNPGAITCAIENKLPDCNNEFAYKNTLMAYGTVSGNSQEIVALEQKIELMANGYKECDAWMRKSKEGDVKPVACKDTGLKSEDVEKASQINVKKEDLAEARKNYGKLSKRVYQASVAGADFTAAAVTKLVGAVVKFPSALSNAHNELSGWKGAVNAVMILPRLKNFFTSIGTYKDNLGIQYTAYSTMYKQIQGTYDVEDTPKTKEAKQRIERVRIALAELEPKLDMIAAGKEVEFTLAEREKWDRLAASFPAESYNLERAILTASRDSL
ncbi:MAG: hypothetical protein HYV06_02635 [Deltaproteobacteria bacterium]|nr:hypothetical protein [Deltaproteobacteria bacterium]